MNLAQPLDETRAVLTSLITTRKKKKKISSSRTGDENGGCRTKGPERRSRVTGIFPQDRCDFYPGSQMGKTTLRV